MEALSGASSLCRVLSGVRGRLSSSLGSPFLSMKLLDPSSLPWPDPSCVAPSRSLVVTYGRRFPHLYSTRGRISTFCWRDDLWSWGMRFFPEVPANEALWLSYEWVASELPSGSCVHSSAGLWGAVQQVRPGLGAGSSGSWMGEFLPKISDLGLCFHPPHPNPRDLRISGERPLLRCLAEGHLSGSLGPGWSGGGPRRVVYSDASVSFDRNFAAFGVASSDGVGGFWGS